MNFRQRIAWLMTVAYLGGTFALLYYLFEINDHYNAFALDHIQRYHSSDSSKTKEKTDAHENGSSYRSFWTHLSDLPLPFWMALLLLPYLQVFLMILACTRAEPRLSFAYMWPGLVYLKYQQFHKQMFNRHETSPFSITMETQVPNGHTVIHT